MNYKLLIISQSHISQSHNLMLAATIINHNTVKNEWTFCVIQKEPYSIKDFELDITENQAKDFIKRFELKLCEPLTNASFDNVYA